MKRFLRESGVPVLLVAVKLLTAMRTGYDTYLVSRDVLNVLLLDGVFLALWMALAYGGDSQQMRRFRPFAVIGAVGMYAAMIYIGWEAHHSSVAYAVRIAGGVALGADIWDWAVAGIASLWARFTGWLARRRDERRRRREEVPDVYAYARRRFLGRLGKSVDRATLKLGAHMDVMVFEQVRAALPEMLDGRFDDVVTVEATPVVTAGATSTDVSLTPKLTSGERRTSIRRQIDETPDVTVTELADMFGVSRGTIYNDLEKLGIEL